MTEYRFYLMDEKGRIAGPPMSARCEDDAAALTQAEELTRGCDVEIWNGNRRVAFVRADHRPLSP